MADQEIDPRITLLEKAWSIPESRKLLEDGFAVAFPKAEIPGRQAREAVKEVEKKLTERENAIDKKLAEWESKTELEKHRENLTKQGYSGDQIKEIEKIMVDEGIGLHVNAAVIYDARTKVAPPRSAPSTSGTMNPQKAYSKAAFAPYFQGIMDGDFHNPGEEWARDRVDTILADFANDRAAAEKKWSDDNYWPAAPGYTPPVK